MNSNSVSGKPGSLARRWLKQSFELKSLIKSIEVQLSVLSGELFSPPSSGDLSRENVQTSLPQEAPFVSLTEKKAALEEELHKKIALYQALNMQMITAINNCLSGKESLILSLWFLQGKKWTEIAYEADRSVKQCRRILEYGLTKIILPKDAIWIKEP